VRNSSNSGQLSKLFQLIYLDNCLVATVCKMNEEHVLLDCPRICDKCDLHDVQDEKHVLFLCPCLEMCYLRRRFEEQFADFAGKTYIGDTGAFYFDKIGAEDVKLFLLKQTYKSFLCISETTDFFLSSWQCPASPAVNPSGWRSKPIVTYLSLTFFWFERFYFSFKVAGLLGFC